MKIVGHKGGGNEAPENTRAGIQHALTLGADAVELDIWPTADGRFVLFHDADIARLTGHAGWTMQLTSTQLCTLEIGCPVSKEATGERILLLEEALELLAGKAGLFLEVKRTRHELDRYAWVEERLVEILDEYDAIPWTTVISFDHRSLFNMHELSSETRVGMLYAGEWLSVWQEVDALEPVSLFPHWAQTTPALVEDAHARGLSIYPWVVNDSEWMEQFAHMGVDGIITDRPGELVRLRRLSDRPVNKTESEVLHD